MQKLLNRQSANVNQCYPEKIVQFGAGNFLRAFADWIIDRLNEKTDFAGSVVVVKASSRQSSPDVYTQLNKQDGLYHLVLTSEKDGQATTDVSLVRCVSRAVNPYADLQAFIDLACQPEIRFVISNTTEAGIQIDAADRLDGQLPNSFPAKLTLFLFERFRHFGGAVDKGCIILPCELIEQNGDELKRCVTVTAEKWGLGPDFGQWLLEHNFFCNTLVDRIVPGYPHMRAADILGQVGFDDQLLVEAENYHSWIIDAPELVQQEFPAAQTGLNVKFVDDVAPYRDMKVRILNGAHTAMVPVGYLRGMQTVHEAINDDVVSRYITQLLFDEILPTLPFPDKEKETMAHDVLRRFRNPFLAHRLLDISLNSTSKFVARLLPSLKAYVGRYEQLPDRICFALAALILFYAGEWNGRQIELKDSPDVLTIWTGIWQQESSIEEKVAQILKNKTLWGGDLTTIAHLAETVTRYVSDGKNTCTLEPPCVTRILS